MKLPHALTIAGSDSGGGAGIQADLKTMAAHRVFGMSAIVAVTAQNTQTVSAVHELPAAMLQAQIDAVFSDIRVDAVKIGMLSSAELIRTVATCLQRWRPPFVVLDPVMISKSGCALLRDEAVNALAEELLPLADLVTPNLPEAERLSGRRVETRSQMLEAARALQQREPRRVAERRPQQRACRRPALLWPGGDLAARHTHKNAQHARHRLHAVLGHSRKCRQRHEPARSLPQGKGLCQTRHSRRAGNRKRLRTAASLRGLVLKSTRRVDSLAKKCAENFV